ncbi:UvrD-helicase domain-containing protein [Streptomyces californicus]
MNDAVKRGQVGTPGALAERDAQVFRAGIHLNRLNSEFEDFLFGRIDLLLGKDGERGPDGAYTSVEPADDAVREDATADIASAAHRPDRGPRLRLRAAGDRLARPGRRPVLPLHAEGPRLGRRRRAIWSKGRQVLGVEDDLMRPELTASLGGEKLPVIGDGALMAALGQARSHTMRDIVSSIQAEQDLVIRAPAASVTEVTGGPGTGKTAVALHRAAYLLYQDRRRYAGGILIVSPTPLLVAYTEGVLPSLGEEGQVAIRAIGLAHATTSAGLTAPPASGSQPPGFRPRCPASGPSGRASGRSGLRRGQTRGFSHGGNYFPKGGSHYRLPAGRCDDREAHPERGFRMCGNEAQESEGLGHRQRRPASRTR